MLRIGMRQLSSATHCNFCASKHAKLSCNPCQYLTKPEQLESANYFDFFCLHDKKFGIDKSFLEQQYKAYQRVLHPDRFTQTKEEDLQEASTQVSAFCSTAYSTLVSDLHRAQYLLKTVYGIEALKEGNIESNSQLAMEVFERRMEIEEADDEDELQAIQMSIQTEFDDKTKYIGDLFEQERFNDVKTALEETKYLEQMLEQIDVKLEKLKS